MSAPFRRRVSDWGDYYGGRTGLWLAGFVLVVGTLVAIALLVDSLPWWGILGFIPPICAMAVLVNGVTSGFRPATQDELRRIRSGHLWHVTGDDTVYDPSTCTANLAPEHCRWISKMSRSDRPFTRRRPAVYAFTNRPRPGQLDIHVPRHKRRHLLRLDGTAATGNIYLSRAGAIALTDGYHGPAHLEHSCFTDQPDQG